MLRRLARSGVLVLVGLSLLAGPLQAQVPHDDPLGREPSTAQAAGTLSDEVQRGATGGGDFDGDGQGALDLDPTGWVGSEFKHVEDAVASGNASRVVDAAANGTCLSPCDELGDLDGDGDSGWDEITAALDYIKDDLVRDEDGGDGSLQGLVNGFLADVLGLGGQDSSLVADAMLAAASTDGPTIRGISHSPVRPAPDATVTVRAVVTDPNGVGGVDLLYKVGDGDVQRGSMDPAAGDVWTAELDGSTAGFEDYGNWSYRVFAHDDAWTGHVTGGDGTATIREIWRGSGDDPPGTTTSGLRNGTVADVTPPDIALIETDLRAGTARPWTIRADVTDNGGPEAIETVRARYRVAGGLPESVEMTREDGHYEATVQVPDRVGELSLVVEATDAAGNAATERASGRVVDVIPPRIDGIRTRTTDAGLSVRVDATDNVGIAGGSLTVTAQNGASDRIDLVPEDGALVATLGSRWDDRTLTLTVQVSDEAGNVAGQTGIHDPLSDRPDDAAPPDPEDDAADDQPSDEPVGDAGGEEDGEPVGPPATPEPGEAPTVPGAGAIVAVLVLAGAARVRDRRRR